ncbi:MAG: hypothetical protein VB106_04390 [Clostridiaceae bacterium]|nr:hypothetical protein [Clostridiaceae bacterium]
MPDSTPVELLISIHAGKPLPLHVAVSFTSRVLLYGKPVTPLGSEDVEIVGAVVSIVTDSPSESELTLPVASVAFAVTV